MRPAIPFLLLMILCLLLSCSDNKKHADSLSAQQIDLDMPICAKVDEWPNLVNDKKHHYSLCDSTGRTDDSKSAAFMLEVSLLENTPDWVKSYINDNLHHEIQEYMFYGENMINKFDIARPIAEMPKFYFNEYRERYRVRSDSIGKEWGEPFPGDLYDYKHWVYPVWKSKDGNFVTYRFHTDGYAHNVHGWEFDWFLTFNLNKNRILGKNDFFSDGEFEKAIQQLGEQLSAYHKDEGWSAAIDLDTSITLGQDSILYEVYKGALYPRPAMTPEGVIFTYQTYLKGGNADGVLHFIQPYSFTKIKDDK